MYVAYQILPYRELCVKTFSCPIQIDELVSQNIEFLLVLLVNDFDPTI